MVKDRAFYRTLLTLALPVALQSLISMSVNMLDNVMVGNLGEVNLSGVALANQLTVLLTFFVRGVSGGSSVLISQYWGKRDMDKIRRIFALVAQFCMVVVTLLMGAAALFPRGVMTLYTNDPAILETSAAYLSIVCFSWFLFTLSDTLIAMLRSVEVVRISLWVSCASLLSNLFFNYCLIFGRLGFPALGIRGAAIATVISRGIELGLVLFFVFRVDKRLSMRFKDFFRFDRALARDFLRYGIPIVIGDMQWGLVGTSKAAIIGRLGATMVAANSIADTVLSLGMVFTNGLASAACVMIGKTVGAQEYDRTREYSKTIQLLFFFVGLVIMVLLFTTRTLPVSLYKVSVETRALAEAMLAVGAVTMLGTTYHAACFTGINRGAGDSRFVFIVDLICGWIIVVPLTLLSGLCWHWPLLLVFLCTRIDQCFKWIIALIRLRGNRWIHNVTR